MDAAPGARSWLLILRLGLVQMAIGAIAVLVISTLNRVMIVEYALPAAVPGALVALHYAVQLLRPRFGHGSDVGGHSTPWIVGGVGLMALGAIGGAIATTLMGTARGAGLALAVAGYLGIGLGAGAAGTSLLALLARTVEAQRRAAAATILWTMMIAGFAITAGIAGRYLDPFSGARLVTVVAVAAALAWLLAGVAIRGVEVDARRAADPRVTHFPTALRAVWAEPRTRRFTAFVFVSMLAYSAEELVLEPFGARVFGLTPGASARLAGALHGGAVVGMVLVGVLCTWLRVGALRGWVMAGCGASALALVALAAGGLAAQSAWLVPSVFLLGLANGAFTVAAIGSMMELASTAMDGREGVRMGLWGAAQAVAFAAGGLVGTAATDLARTLVASPALAYGAVYALESALFIAALRLALTLGGARATAPFNARAATLPRAAIQPVPR